MDPLPRRERERRADEVVRTALYQQYRDYDHESINGHVFQIFDPNGTRQCGFITCINCCTGIVHIIVNHEDIEHPVEESLKTILHTPTGDSDKAADVINAYFDVPCRSQFWRESVPDINQISHAVSLQTGKRVTNLSHAGAQGAKRNRERQLRDGKKYVNRGHPLSSLDKTNKK
eukprot:gb/GECG01014606.1/.p1 GENE.gb/GECG01014606.1/~~gb/GECG01014606.1/.p1  ORF type:complete len:174 (+),score=12.83 gb/GECG01014606.1/:1-522(+)